ncbi:EGH1 [Symbiodinium necroappetens]|uniref:EGH1 protein n=1 Tax=Symbiodinium necroappetens TaxID=1628268 RepID=A0A812SH50_9DINO|nr:EGH1 [Symbiodinium necroappetens]
MLQLGTSWTSCSSSSPQPVGVRRGRPRVCYIKPVCSHAGVACAAAASLCGKADLRRRRRSKRFGSAQPVERAPLPSSGRLRIEGSHFADDKGRIVIPKGINFSGLSKVPLTPNGATHIRGPQFYEHREVSFVGRPCSLEDLDMHLQRLTDWGYNLLRLLVTWEAVEHAGPGIYDGEYLQFIARVCERAADYGFWIVIDPHQDCWSRWTGGDGAPGWTLEAAGFHIGPALHKSGAAFLHQENGDPLPSMSWPSNYDRLACATMFSLFWAGDRVAPSVTSQVTNGVPARTARAPLGYSNSRRITARAAWAEHAEPLEALHGAADGLSVPQALRPASSAQSANLRSWLLRRNRCLRQAEIPKHESLFKNSLPQTCNVDLDQEFAIHQPFRLGHEVPWKRLDVDATKLFCESPVSFCLIDSNVVMCRGLVVRTQSTPYTGVICQLPSSVHPSSAMIFAVLCREPNSQLSLKTVAVNREGMILGSLQPGCALDLSGIRFAMHGGFPLIDGIQLFSCKVGSQRFGILQGRTSTKFFHVSEDRALASIPADFTPSQRIAFAIPGAREGGFHLLHLEPGSQGGQLQWSDAVWNRDELEISGVIFEMLGDVNCLPSALVSSWSEARRGIVLMDFHKLLLSKYGSLNLAWEEAFDIDDYGCVDFAQFSLGCRRVKYCGNVCRLWSMLDPRNTGAVTFDSLLGDSSLQQLLQDGFINAMVQIARSVKHVPSVLGFETMNEPHPGWLGRSDFTKAQFGAVSAGQSPLEQLQRCAPGEGSPWASSCLWAQAGVWDPLSQELLDASSFECDWLADCFAPFVTRFAEKVVGEMPHALIGVCPPAFGKEGQQPFPEKMPVQAFWAPHFYDGVVLVGKTWTPAFGIEETKPGTTLLGGLLPAPPIVPVFGLQERLASYKRQLEQKCRLASQETASMLGEIGVPFDIQSPGMATTDALRQAIDVHMRALEELFLPYCWWNYTPENSKARGDGWNGEDLSILGEGGGRALDAIVRPCLLACAGKPTHQAFNLQEHRFQCEFDADIGETIFFIPSRHFKPDNAILSVTPGTHVVWNVDLQSLLCRTDRAGRVAIDLRQKESKGETEIPCIVLLGCRGAGCFRLAISTPKADLIQ